MLPNPAIPKEIWEKLVSLPSKSLPKKQVRPIKRLTALAHELAADGILANAGKTAHTHLHEVLDKAQDDFSEDIKNARQSVLVVEGKTAKTTLDTQEMTFNDFVEDADLVVIDDAYKRAARLLSPDLAKTYSEYLASQNNSGADEEEALVEAHTDIAAIGMVPAIKDVLEKEAEKLANKWLTDHEEAIQSLKDARQDVYRELRELSMDPLDVKLAMPRNRLVPTTELEENGQEVPLQLFADHLLCDAKKLFPAKFNSWELKVLEQEAKHSDFSAWYRNPSSAIPESLGITYSVDGQQSILRPDFIFFSQTEDGSVKAHIVDPHGGHFADSLPKLLGLCDYAEQYAEHYGRIEAVAKIGKSEDTYRVLDLKDVDVRTAIRKGPSAKALYSGENATPYPNSTKSD